MNLIEFIHYYPGAQVLYPSNGGHQYGIIASCHPAGVLTIEPLIPMEPPIQVPVHKVKLVLREGASLTDEELLSIARKLVPGAHSGSWIRHFLTPTGIPVDGISYKEEAILIHWLLRAEVDLFDLIPAGLAIKKQDPPKRKEERKPGQCLAAYHNAISSLNCIS